MKNIFILTSAVLLLSSLPAQAGFYRWVDEAGEVHFSDKVPVAASKKAVSQMNKHGIVQNVVDPEAEALAKLKYNAEKENRERLEALKREKEQQQQILKQRDNYLLSTYENKDEITKSFTSKIKLLKGNAAILDAQTQVLEKRLMAFEKRHSSIKNKATKASLHNKIISITETINQYNQALSQNENERLALSKSYKTDLNRYIELTK